MRRAWEALLLLVLFCLAFQMAVDTIRPFVPLLIIVSLLYFAGLFAWRYFRRW